MQWNFCCCCTGSLVRLCWWEQCSCVKLNRPVRLGFLLIFYGVFSDLIELRRFHIVLSNFVDFHRSFTGFRRSQPNFTEFYFSKCSNLIHFRETSMIFTTFDYYKCHQFDSISSNCNELLWLRQIPSFAQNPINNSNKLHRITSKLNHHFQHSTQNQNYVGCRMCILPNPSSSIHLKPPTRSRLLQPYVDAIALV